MKASELKVKSVDELSEELAKLYKDYFVYQMQKGLGQLGQTHLLKNAKRDIARVKTVMKQLS